MPTRKWVLPQLPILIALEALSSYQMLFTSLHELAYIVVRLDVLYPLEYLLVLLKDIVQLTDTDSMIECGNDLICPIVRARL